MKRFFSILLCLFFYYSLPAQSWAVKHSVMPSAVVQEDPPAITLHWPDNDPNATGFQVFRRSPGTASWGAAQANLSAGATEYTDSGVLSGEIYEYRILKSATGNNGYGYLTAGIKAPETESRGILLLVVDSTHAAALSMEIDRLIADLRGDGWIVKRIDVDPAYPVPLVKDLIVTRYEEAPNMPHSIFLLGHVPVPYSGNINPDGHPDHQGAWPADGYYGDVDGAWTDFSVNNTVATGTRNDNVPGDGKFDQSVFPSELEMEVGRVDFAKLPAFGLSETELLRRYLEKNHAFRHGMIETTPRGLVEDNFGSFEEGFSQTGLRNFAAFFGADSVFLLDYRSTLQSNSYLWSYGCGGGSYTSCSGITNTNNFTTDSLLSVFTILFGSYFGDWDSDNNLLRAALASGQTLSNAWAGRPNWHFHPMALGATLGHCAKLTQNNPTYWPGYYGNKFVHIALMGDPSLRMHVVKPASSLVAVEDNGNALLSWEASPEATDGYHLYRKAEGEEAFVRVNESPIQDLYYTDSCLVAGVTYTYLLRARKLETSGSGSYYNLSQGIETDLAVTTDLSVTAGFDLFLEDDQLSLTNTSQNASQYLWDFGDGNTSTEPSPTHVYQVIGEYEVSLIASNVCFSDTISQMITVTVAGVGEKVIENSWRIFPNPTRDQLHIESESIIGPVIARIVDLQGRTVLEKRLHSGQSLHLSNLPAGSYLLQLEGEGKRWAQSVQKE